MKNLRHVSSERNLRTERLIFCKSLICRDGDLLLTNKYPPRMSPHPQDNELPAWTMAGLVPLCTPCP